MTDRIATLDGYGAFVRQHGRVFMVGDAPWVLESRKLTPLAPPHRQGPVNGEHLQRAMRASGAWVALWNDAWDTEPGPWWWICCDARDFGLERIEPSRRKSVRKALRECSVRRLETEWFAEHGYEVYAAAHARYGHVAPVSRAAFKAGAMANAEYAGRETWGAFVGDALAAYASCIVIDDVVKVSSAKSVPALLKHRPNDALHFMLRQHYLVERKMLYTTDGARVLEHDTHVQDFYETLGSRRIYCPLRIQLHPLLAAAIRLRAKDWARLLQLPRWHPALFSRISALAVASGIAEACAPADPGRG